MVVYYLGKVRLYDIAYWLVLQEKALQGQRPLQELGICKIENQIGEGFCIRQALYGKAPKYFFGKKENYLYLFLLSEKQVAKYFKPYISILYCFSANLNTKYKDTQLNQWVRKGDIDMAMFEEATGQGGELIFK